MSTTVERPTCRYPGCSRPAVERSADVGPRPAYCYQADAPGEPVHNPLNAYRLKGRAAPAGVQGGDAESRPVSTARLSAAGIRDQVLTALDQAREGMERLTEELRVVADPDAAELELATAVADMESRVADARGQAARAEAEAGAARGERDQAVVAADEIARQAEEAERGRAAAEGAAEVARNERDEAQRRAEAAEAEQVAAAGRATEQVSQALAEVERVRGEAAAAIEAAQARAQEEVEAAGRRATETIAGIRSEANARVQAEQRAAVSARERAEQLEHAMGEAQAQHEQRVEDLRGRVSDLSTQVEQLRGQLSSLQGEAAAATERHRSELAELERRHDARVDQERAAWTRAIGAAEQLATSRGEDLTAVRGELATVRSERDRLADQVSELRASEEPSGDEPGPDAGGRRRRGGGR